MGSNNRSLLDRLRSAAMRAAAARAVLVLIVAMLAGLVHADAELPRRGQMGVRLAAESGLVRVDAVNPGSAAGGPGSGPVTSSS